MLPLEAPFEVENSGKKTSLPYCSLLAESCTRMDSSTEITNLMSTCNQEGFDECAFFFCRAHIHIYVGGIDFVKVVACVVEQANACMWSFGYGTMINATVARGF